MTPIQYFLVLGHEVYVVDFAFLRRQIAVCPTSEDAVWIAWSLGGKHGVNVLHGEEAEAQYGRNSRADLNHHRITEVVVRDAESSTDVPIQLGPERRRARALAQCCRSSAA